MSKFVGIVIGGLEIAAGVVVGALTAWTGVGLYVAGLLITAGAGMLLSGIGSLTAGTVLTGPQGGVAVASRNPIAPQLVIYGRTLVGGTVIYLNEWGNLNKYLDMVIVLAAHPCESVDALLFDTQIVQLATSNPWFTGDTSYDSFSPLQQTIFITQIVRFKNVITVTLQHPIPLLQPGDRIGIGVNGINQTGLTDANGIWSVQTTSATAPAWSSATTYVTGIVVTYLDGGFIASAGSTNQAPFIGSAFWTSFNVFTAISGGTPGSANNGQVVTLWPDYGRHIHMEALLGNQVATFSGMLYGTPNEGDPTDLVAPAQNYWTGTALVKGKTAVFLRLNYDATTFGAGLPQISFLVHGKNDILDPRTMTTGYTENAALSIADYLANTYFGFNAAYASEIPYAPLITAANICDQLVALAAGGTEPAYALNGKFDLSAKRGDVLQNMLTACAGRLTYVSGQFIVWPAAWYGSSPAPDPGLGNMSGSFKWKSTVSIRDLFNGVKGTYVCPANNWQPGDIPPYAQDTTHGYTIGPAWSNTTAYVIGNIVAFSSADYIALVNNTGHQPDVSPTQWASIYEDINLTADGGQRRWKDIALPFTISSSAAQRICKIELLRSRFQGTGTFRYNLVAYSIATMDVITMTNSFMGWTNKLFEVIAARFVLDKQKREGADVTTLGVEIDVQETDSSVYDWNDTEELTPSGYQQSAMPNPFTPAAPTNLALESDETTAVLTAAGLADSILVTWTAPVDAFVTQGGRIEVQYQELQQYSAGTFSSASPPAANLVGSGTTWTSDMAGGTFIYNGTAYGIASVTDATHMTLSVPGPAVSGAIYTIIFAAAWIGLPSVNNSVTQVNINGVTDGTQYNVQIRAVNTLNVPSAWVEAGPVTASGANLPLPWMPHSEAYPWARTGYSFSMTTELTPGFVQLQGTLPVTVLSTVATAPTIDPFAVITPHTGNTLPVMSGLIQVFGIDSAGARSPGSNYSQFSTTVAASRISFTVTFGASTVGYEIFLGSDATALVGFGAVTPGTLPTTLIIDAFPARFPGSYGPPNPRAVRARGRGKVVVHGGIGSANVGSVTSGTTLTIAVPAALASNALVNRYLINVSIDAFNGLNHKIIGPISLSDTGFPLCTVTVPATGDFSGVWVADGDLVMISTYSDTNTAASIGDSGLTLIDTSGLTVNAETGEIVRVLLDPTGAANGATSTVVSNSTTVASTTQFKLLNGTPVTPGAGSVFIFEAPAWAVDVNTSIAASAINPAPGSEGFTVLVTVPTPTLEGFVALFQVNLQDVSENDSIDTTDNIRLLYIPLGSLNGYFVITTAAGIAILDPDNGQTQVVTLPDDGSLLTITIAGALPAAGYPLKFFIRTPPTGTWQTPAFTGGANGFASDIAAGTRYSSSPVASTQDELDFIFHGAGSTVTMSDPTIGGAIT